MVLIRQQAHRDVGWPRVTKLISTWVCFSVFFFSGICVFCKCLQRPVSGQLIIKWPRFSGRSA